MLFFFFIRRRVVGMIGYFGLWTSHPKRAYAVCFD